MRIDFLELKATVSIEQIIAWLSIDLKKTGAHQLRGICPIHNGSNDRQFVVSTDKNLWHCFGDCNGGGDIIELVARLQKISQKQAAEMISSHFSKASVAVATIRKLEPLDYLDPDHAALHALGITKETCVHFNAGYKGLLSGRLALPIYRRGELLAYCGRSVKREQDPMLAFPKDFDPSSAIFNADNVTGSMIYVTDDPLRSLVAHQHGITNVVALHALTSRSFALLAEFMTQIGVERAEWL